MLLRLPLAVKPVFLDWFDRTRPDSRPRIEAAIRSARDGQLSSSKFGARMKGTGERSDQISRLFNTFAARHGLNHRLPAFDCEQFVAPLPDTGQLRLF